MPVDTTRREETGNIAFWVGCTQTVLHVTKASVFVRPIHRYRVLRVATTVAGSRSETVCNCRGFEPFNGVPPIAGERVISGQTDIKNNSCTSMDTCTYRHTWNSWRKREARSSSQIQNRSPETRG